jgi:O-antigen/teichoic acid export membrane protein
LQLITGLRTRSSRIDRHRLDAFLTTFAGTALYGLSLITGPLLARALDPSGRGALAAVLVPTQLFGWLIMLGVPVAVAYHAKGHSKAELATATWIVSLVVGVPATALLWPFIPRFLDGYDPMLVTWFRAYLVIGLVSVPVGGSIELIRARSAGVRFNVLRSLAILINTGLIVVLALLDRLTLTTALFAMAFATLVQAAVVLGLTRWWPSGGFSWPVLRRLFDYGLRVAFGTLAGLVVARLDQLLMVNLVSPAELGLYVVGATGAGVTIPISQGVSTALFPHLRTDDAAVNEQRFAEAMRWVLLSTVGISCVIAAVAPFGIPLLFGEAFADAVPALLILLPGQVASGLAMVIASKLQAQGRPGVASQAMAIGAVVTVIGIAPAVAIGGIEGAAALTTLCHVVVLVRSQLALRADAGAQRGDAPLPVPVGPGGDDLPG